MSRDFDNASAYDFGDISALKIAGTTLTVACWAYNDSVATRDRYFGYTAWDTNTGLRGWSFGRNTSGWIFSKAGVVDITAAGTFSTGSWQFAAAAMTSGSNVFYRMTADGTVTTGTSNNNQSMSYGASIHHALAGARSVGTSGGLADEMDGKICEIGVWDVKLTQDELVAYAYGGPWACGVKPVFYAPLWGASAAEPELSGVDVTGSVIGTATAADHAPVGPRVPVAA